MGVIHGVHLIKTIVMNDIWMAEWSVLHNSQRGDSSSIPVGDKIFFGGIKSLEQYITCHFELNEICLS